MRHVIVAGGPGAGKTTLIAELVRRGHRAVSDSAREVIAERRAQGLPPRPDARAFTAEVLRRDEAKRAALAGSAAATARDAVVFHDRSVLESLAMLHQAGGLDLPALRERCAARPFHARVFVLPPWPAIYRTDAERDHPFEHARRVHDEVVRWYASLGFVVDTVPCADVAARADHVLQRLAAAAGEDPADAMPTLRPLTPADLPLMHAWRHCPHVARWWGGLDARPTWDEVCEDHDPAARARDGVTPYLVLLGGTPVGHAQSYVATMGHGDGWWTEITDPGVRGIDQFIGEAALIGRGLGVRLVQALAARLFADPAVTAIQTDPAPDNRQAIRCYEKAGFDARGVVTTPDGPALYMLLTRQAWAARAAAPVPASGAGAGEEGASGGRT